VNKAVTDEFLAGMAKGVRIHNQMTKPCKRAPDREVRFLDRADPGPEPADPPDGRGVRLRA
jgi:hypothetical protein